MKSTEAPALPVTESLMTEIIKAIYYLRKFTDHEEGGYIMLRHGEYKFVPIKNGLKHPKNVALFEPADDGMVEVFELEDNSWDRFASIHNHPKWPARPSIVDLDNLFLEFNRNLIYSNVTDEVALFDSTGKLLFKTKV